MYPVLKLLVLIAYACALYYLGFSRFIIFLCCLALIGLYQRAIAACMGWIYMPPMDQACFVSTSKSHVNYMSFTGFGGGVLGEEDCLKLYRDTLRMHPKLTYKVETLGGDMYYGKMSEEEAMEKAYVYLKGDKAVRTQHDIDCFV